MLEVNNKIKNYFLSNKNKDNLPTRMEKKKTPIIQQQYMNTISMILVGFGFFPGKFQLYSLSIQFSQFTNGGCCFGCEIETSDVRRPVPIVDEVVGVEPLVVGYLVVGTGDYMDEIEHLDECLHHPCSVLKSAGAPVCVEKVKMLFVFSQDKQYWTESSGDVMPPDRQIFFQQYS